MRSQAIFLLFAGLCMLIPLQHLSAETTPDFGIHLYKRGNDESAALELERFIFSSGEDVRVPEITLLLSLSYARLQQYERALGLLGAISAGSEIGGFPPAGALVCEAEFHSLNILFRQKRFSDFRMRLERMRTVCPEIGAELGSYLQSMSTAAYIFALQWEEAYFDLQNWEVPVSSLEAELEAELVSIMNFRKKSPVVGGLLSIVPGLGHMYAGRFPDGIRSLLLNAAFTSLAVISFQEDMAVLGGVFTVVEGVLYISNVYGGINAVQQENARMILGSRDRMLKLLPVPPLDVITIRKEIGL
jgi:hypothetical protein